MFQLSDGLDVEVLTKKTGFWFLPRTSSHFDVTSFVSKTRMIFIHQVLSEPDLGSLHWTVDEPIDLELITKFMKNIPLKPNFLMKDVLALYSACHQLCQTIVTSLVMRDISEAYKKSARRLISGINK